MQSYWSQFMVALSKLQAESYFSRQVTWSIYIMDKAKTLLLEELAITLDEEDANPLARIKFVAHSGNRICYLKPKISRLARTLKIPKTPKKLETQNNSKQTPIPQSATPPSPATEFPGPKSSPFPTPTNSKSPSKHFASFSTASQKSRLNPASRALCTSSPCSTF